MKSKLLLKTESRSISFSKLEINILEDLSNLNGNKKWTKVLYSLIDSIMLEQKTIAVLKESKPKYSSTIVEIRKMIETAKSFVLLIEKEIAKTEELTEGIIEAHEKYTQELERIIIKEDL